MTEVLYKIVRYYHPDQGKPNEDMQFDLTLEEAQAHCEYDDSKEEGVWFEGFRKQDPTDEDLEKEVASNARWLDAITRVT